VGLTDSKLAFGFLACASGGLPFERVGIIPTDGIGKRAKQHQGGALDARQRLQAFEQRAIEGGAGAVIGELVAQLNLRCHDAARIEARRQAGEPAE
jgi:hypothetical protein